MLGLENQELGAMAAADHSNPFDSRQLRSTLGAFITGVTVVTTIDAEGKRHGVTANSFSSVSLDPPLILWSQALSSKSFEAFRHSERFVVNIMAHHQMPVSNQFARSGDDKFTGIACSAGLGGVPIIDDSAAHLECTKVAAYPGGDHVIYIGRVERIHRSAHAPLAFGEGRYLQTVAHVTPPAVAIETLNAATPAGATSTKEAA